MVALPYAGDAEHAKAKPLAQQVPKHQLLWALAWCLPLLAFAPWALFPVAAAVALLMSLWLRRRLGGYTGDTLGATEQVAEAALLLALAA
jgi:adenosylcobinamide-GDP ribazoletransferase